MLCAVPVPVKASIDVSRGFEKTSSPSSFVVTRVDGAYQVWFRGAHSDVGGGNKNRPRNDIALKWMMCKAKAAQLPEAGVREMYRGEKLPEQIASINAYLGAFPIAAEGGLTSLRWLPCMCASILASSSAFLPSSALRICARRAFS